MRKAFTSSCLALVLLVQSVISLKLNVTALSAENGSSIFQCWQMDQPFETSSQAGTSGTALLMLSDVSNLTYGVIPSNFDGGVHNAPNVQYVLPSTSEQIDLH